MRRDLVETLFERGNRKKFVPKGEVKDRQRYSLLDDDCPAEINGRREDYYRDYGWPSYSLTRKILTKAVGRVWNEVWSEICQQADPRTYTGWMVREEFKRNVNTTWPNSKYGVDSVISPRESFYVDGNGILCATDQLSWRNRHRYQAPKEPLVKKVSDELEYRLIDGLWFEVRLKPIPESLLKPVPIDFSRRQHWMYPAIVGNQDHTHSEHFKDVVTGLSSRLYGMEAAVYPRRKYAYSKRSASRSAITNFKLREME